MVKNAPLEKESIENLINFIDNNIIVAHNAPFDLGFLHASAQRNNITPSNYNFYCTRAMSSILFPNLSHRLIHMCELFDINLSGSHRALNDSTATLELFSRLKYISNSNNIDFINKIVQHSDREIRFVPSNSKIIKLNS